MRKITEKMGLHKEWYKKASEIELKDLDKFIKKLNNFEHGYGTACHATAAAAVATAFGMAKEHDITSFQAGAIMWGFIKNWNHRDNKIGMGLIKYDDLLYPQYEEEFQKTMSKEMFKRLQNEAAKLLKDKDCVPKEVLEHWESIVGGKAPFGYKIIGGNE